VAGTQPEMGRGSLFHERSHAGFVSVLTPASNALTASESALAMPASGSSVSRILSASSAVTSQDQDRHLAIGRRFGAQVAVN
jgi:hypothetical protein